MRRRRQPIVRTLGAVLFAGVGALHADPSIPVAAYQPEAPDDPPGTPAPHVPGAGTRGGPVTFGPYSAVQVNVDALGGNILGDAANEPSIAIDPTNPMRMAIGWRQFDTVASNFRQAGIAYSTDGGATWTFPGVLDPGQFRSDPVSCPSIVQGNFYYSSLSSVDIGGGVQIDRTAA